MDLVQIYRDHSVNYLTEGHKHCRPGWVNTPCPFCTGNYGYHLGGTLDGSHFYCWRCGSHPVKKVLAQLLNLPEYKIKDLLRQYAGTLPELTTVRSKEKKKHKYPTNITPLMFRHKKYLEKRGFDPERLERDWELVATNVVSTLDKADYGNRIMAPIYWEGERVSFQARAISEKKQPKYKACPTEREIIHHKVILYGRQDMWKETGICVEGITDVWRLGFNAFATFGIEYKIQQVRAIAKGFKRVAVVFDDDPQAVIKAEQLVADLCFRGVDAFRIPIVGDPGGMKNDDAKYLVKQIMKKS